jgi:carboxypeptidase Taq
VRAIASRADRVDNACLCREFDEQLQWDFGVEVLKAYGFDFQAGRQDKSVHPFTTGFGLGDTRITTRVDRGYLPAALFGSLHECGHALYDMGYRPELEGTPLAGGASLGVHESQSRLWENLVGRSRGFWLHFFPRLRQVFPAQLADHEADEVTYNLHIMLRFELENDLVEGKLAVSDVPEAWNSKMTQYLGVVPPNDAMGCLQDIHWSQASLGYFSTYSLGNLFSVQLFDQAVKDVPSIPGRIAQGEFSDLLGWLRERVHQHGRKYTLNELAVRVTGEPLQSRSYLAYLKGKYGEIYGLG